MKKIFIMVVVAVALVPGTRAASTIQQKEGGGAKCQVEGAARAADSLYRQGDYEGAVEGYEGVLAAGFSSADVYYNLGNAYYRRGQTGRAILNYERALRLSPGMRDARENLALAGSQTTDRIAELPRLVVVEWYERLVVGLAPRTWRMLVTVLFAAACAAGAVVTLSRRIGVRKTALAVLLGAGAGLVAAVWFTTASTLRFNRHSEAVVLQPSVAVKSSPEVQSVDKLILHEGTKVTISERLAGWDRITLADGTTGWCQEENIERI